MNREEQPTSKGQRVASQLDPDKPITEMSAREWTMAIDEIRAEDMAEIRAKRIASELENARQCKNPGVGLAIVALLLPDGRKEVLAYLAEYGDGEGTSACREIAEDLEQEQSLFPGEQLQVVTVGVPMLSELAHMNIDLHGDMDPNWDTAFYEARTGLRGNMKIAVLYLVRDEKRSIIEWDVELGDWEGVENEFSVAEEIESNQQLRMGEHLLLHVVLLPPLAQLENGA